MTFIVLQLAVCMVTLVQLASSADLWTPGTNDVHGTGGVPHSIAVLDDCKSYCMDDSQCVAVDWEPKNSGRECWTLTGTWTYAATEPGHLTNYQLNRTVLDSLTSAIQRLEADVAALKADNDTCNLAAENANLRAKVADLEAQAGAATCPAQLTTDISKLQRDVTQLKYDRRQRNVTGCPSGFSYLSTFNGGCYKVVTERKNWDDAAANCRQLNSAAHLVVINDDVEMKTLDELTKSMSTAVSGCTGFATAGQRIDPSGSKFVWRVKSADGNSETVSLITYTDWYTGEPSNSGGIEDCVKMYKDHDGKWNDYSCTNTECSICEVDI